jgi:peptidoglycan hydrolase CwlO-like protein
MMITLGAGVSLPLLGSEEEPKAPPPRGTGSTSSKTSQSPSAGTPAPSPNSSTKDPQDPSTLLTDLQRQLGVLQNEIGSLQKEVDRLKARNGDVEKRVWTVLGWLAGLFILLHGSARILEELRKLRLTQADQSRLQESASHLRRELASLSQDLETVSENLPFRETPATALLVRITTAQHRIQAVEDALKEKANA